MPRRELNKVDIYDTVIKTEMASEYCGTNLYNKYLVCNHFKTAAGPGKLDATDQMIANMWSAKCQKCSGNAPYTSHFNRPWICDFQGLRCTKMTVGDKDQCSFHCVKCGTDICQGCVMWQKGTQYTNPRGRG